MKHDSPQGPPGQAHETPHISDEHAATEADYEFWLRGEHKFWLLHAAVDLLLGVRPDRGLQWPLALSLRGMAEGWTQNISRGAIDEEAGKIFLHAWGAIDACTLPAREVSVDLSRLGIPGLPRAPESPGDSQWHYLVRPADFVRWANSEGYDLPPQMEALADGPKGDEVLQVRPEGEQPTEHHVSEEDVASDPVPAPDFRSVSWNGQMYSFTVTQAQVFEMLWNAWNTGATDVSAEFILGEINSGQRRLRDAFRRGKKTHPAWKKLIVPGATKGTVRLAPTPRKT